MHVSLRPQLHWALKCPVRNKNCPGWMRRGCNMKASWTDHLLFLKLELRNYFWSLCWPTDDSQFKYIFDIPHQSLLWSIVVFEHGPNKQNLSHTWAQAGTEQKGPCPCSMAKILRWGCVTLPSAHHTENGLSNSDGQTKSSNNHPPISSKSLAYTNISMMAQPRWNPFKYRCIQRHQMRTKKICSSR